MPEHLRRLAAARHDESLRRAMEAVRAMARAGDTVNFATVSRRAGVSSDFLYSVPELRSTIAQLRRPGPRQAVPVSTAALDTPSTSSAVRALSSQIKAERKAHREEVSALKAALESAYGEILRLKRRIRD